jgi:RHS repeat-associated protein
MANWWALSSYWTKIQYAIAGQRVAMDDGSGLLYLLTDHLVSVVAVANPNGSIVEDSEQRYMPFGQPRLTADAPTDFGYTGQRALTDVGLMDYNARWYDASLGRFVSADTMVPGASNPQAWNRYAYVVNNPMRLVDPSGNKPCDEELGCDLNLGKKSEPVEIDWSKYCRENISSNSENCKKETRREKNKKSDIVIWCLKNPIECINKRYNSGSDYTVLSGTLPPMFVGFTGQITADRYGNWYFSFGLSQTASKGASWNAGWLISPTTPSEGDIESFVTSHTAYLSGGVLFGGAATWGDPSFVRDPEFKDFAVEGGLTTPGEAFGYTHGFLIYDANSDISPWFFQDFDWFDGPYGGR